MCQIDGNSNPDPFIALSINNQPGGDNAPCFPGLLKVLLFTIVPSNQFSPPAVKRVDEAEDAVSVQQSY
ncbi:hypothetical protein ES703_56632 [subsurface metagenome]